VREITVFANNGHILFLLPSEMAVFVVLAHKDDFSPKTNIARAPNFVRIRHFFELILELWQREPCVGLL
jgi:hypothetical protein